MQPELANTSNQVHEQLPRAECLWDQQIRSKGNEHASHGAIPDIAMRRAGRAGRR